MSTPSSIADFLNRLGPVAVAKLDAYPIKTNVERSVTGDMVNSALQDLANLLSNLLADKMDEMTVDSTPTAGSSNLVSSGGVAEAITAGIASALSAYMTSAQVTQAIATALLPYAKSADVATEVATQISAALAGYSTTAQMQAAIADAIGDALANYSTTQQMNFAISNAINNALVSYSTTAEVSQMITNALTLYPSIQDMNSAIASALTGYLSAQQTYDAIADALTDYVTNTSLAATLASYYTKPQMDTALAGKQDVLTFDDTPTEGSDNPVKSGGIYDAIADAVVAVEAWVQGAFARIDGYYQTLTAGAAENLVGHGTTPAVISFRPAGGTQDIGSGAASIAKIKGRTDGWNQLVNTGDTEVATISGHKYFSFVAGVSSIVNGGSPIALDDAAKDKVTDLTLMYGSGKEPATVAAFLAEYPEALTAPYNAGKLIPNKVTALVTDGFNQWNERWFNGAINEQGQAYSSASNIAAYNYMPCFPSMNYAYDSHKIVALFWYDANRNFIYRSSNADTGIKVVTSPANAAYFRFYARSAYGATYKNDLAINLSHSGIRNGEYEPYWKSTLNIVHSQIWGKLNGAGEMVQVAPNGFRGVGSNCDEVDIVRKEAYIRRAWVDLGDLTWTLHSGGNFFMAELPQSPEMPASTSAVPAAATSKYLASNNYEISNGNVDKYFSIGRSGVSYAGYCIVRDTAYTTADFKAAMSGVYLDFQLATPLHYTDLMYSEDGGQTFTEIPSNYRVDDFGTEQRFPSGIVDGAPASTPLVADIAYAMNAVDTLRRLPQTYLSKESTENLLAALQTAGVIAGYTMTYDSDNEQYDFTITPNA